MEDSLPLRSRKFFYDEYSGKFVGETRKETLDRLSYQRQEYATTRNKNQVTKLQDRYKEIAEAEKLFLSNKEKEITNLKMSLTNMVAHKRALSKVAASREASRQNEDYLNDTELGRFGTYGLNAGLMDLHDLLETEKQKMTPSYRRQKKVKVMLGYHKNHEATRKRKNSKMNKNGRESIGGEYYKNVMLPSIVRHPSRTAADATDDNHRGIPTSLSDSSLPPIFLTTQAGSQLVNAKNSA